MFQNQGTAKNPTGIFFPCRSELITWRVKTDIFFEAGAGITYYSGNIHLVDNVGDSVNGENTNGIFGNLTFGYRKQPVDGGFSFRAGVSPIITKNSFKPYWPYVSFGYAF